jgi:hypothetical protein
MFDKSCNKKSESGPPESPTTSLDPLGISWWLLLYEITDAIISNN